MKTPNKTQTESTRAAFILRLLLIVIIAGVVTYVLRATSTSEASVDSLPVPSPNAEVPRLPQDMEQKLTEALEAPPVSVPSMLDPFVDRGGLTANKPLAIAPRPAPAIVHAPVIPGFQDRYSAWRRAVFAARSANLPDPHVTSVYLMEELDPVGLTGTEYERRALLFVRPEKRSFSATVGTRFYDAVLDDITEGGVRFRTTKGVRFVEWSTGSKEGASEPPTRPVDRRERPANTDPVRGLQEAVRERYKDQSATLNPATGYKIDLADLRAVPTGAEYRNSENRNSTYLGAYDKRDRMLMNRLPGPDRWGGVNLAHLVLGQVVPKDSPSDQDVSASHEGQVDQGGQAGLLRARVRFASASEVALIPVAVFYRQSSDTPKKRNSSTPITEEEMRALAGAYKGNARTGQQPEQRGMTVRELREAQAGGAPAPDPAQSTLAPQQTESRPRYTNPPKEDASGTARDVPTVQVANVPAPARTLGSRAQTPVAFCDPSYTGAVYSITNTRSIPLVNFVEELHRVFGVNIIVDPEAQEVPVRVSIANAPWATILRTVLELNDLSAVCLDGGSIVQIVPRTKIEKLEVEKRKASPIITKVFKLRYIQPIAGGSRNLAGQIQNTTLTLQSLEEAIRKILRAGGDDRGEVTRVPGRNELIVAGTADHIQAATMLIERVDRPGYQVQIQALVYTVSDTRLKDVGSQFSAIVGNVSQNDLGGFSSLPKATTTGGGGQGAGGPAGRDPGGVPGLARNMRQPSDRLQAPNPAGVVGVSSIIGTGQFAYQLSLAEQKGAANIQARPYGTVTDGNTIDLVAGSQIPVVTSVVAGGAVAQTGNVQFIEASRVLRITPQVAEDENGTPVSVTLIVQLENNAVDTSLPAFGGLPSLARQSLQTIIRLKDNETGIIGGLAADSVSETTNQIPLVGSIPGIGWLFKRKTNQVDRSKLYFAITARVIPQDAPMLGVPAPDDARTELPPPPPPQTPGPYKRKN